MSDALVRQMIIERVDRTKVSRWSGQLLVDQFGSIEKAAAWAADAGYILAPDDDPEVANIYIIIRAATTAPPPTTAPPDSAR